MTRRLQIVVQEAGLRLDLAVRQAASDLSRRRARTLIEQGAVFVDGQRCQVASRVLASGARLAIHVDVPESVKALPKLYEDDAILVIDKPTGIHVNETETSARFSVMHWFPQVHLVHRLDKDTTGVLLLAKSASVANELSEAFRTRQVEKTYVAIVSGRPVEGWIEAPIGPDRRRPQARMVRPDGKEARTHVEVLRTEGGVSVLRLNLATGRTHQLRVHLSHAGTPIVGDLMYGGPSAVRYLKEIVRPGRPLLHALGLKVKVKGRAHHFRSSLPEDIARFSVSGLDVL